MQFEGTAKKILQLYLLYDDGGPVCVVHTDMKVYYVILLFSYSC